ncbi:PadR family transcriptional regulator [Alkalibacillus haloalkaliphilus]|uniref:PadR family transcriptional regulator n=1 Tax=Alkalibacillus haloalkaliphilus TaxID=94136 RepID=UPI0002D79A94|nr:PadR family transcriptional regulator [Alkalibacillus haloalkaliphilus]
MNAQFKKGVLELCVLMLINQKDQYGYELAQNISKNISIAEGSLYPLLRRLTKEEYCSTYLAESKEGPPRKYYTLTHKGKVHMNYLIEEWKWFSGYVDELAKEVSGGE